MSENDIPEPTRRAYDPALSDVLGDAGLPLSVTAADGKRWTFGFPTQQAKDRLEKLVFEAERGLIHTQKRTGILTPEEYEARCDKLARQVEERQHATGGLLWLKHTVSGCLGDGSVMWVQSLLMEHHPQVTRAEVAKLLAEDGEQVRLVLGVIVPPFVAWVLGLAVPLLDRLVAAGDEKAADALKKLDAVKAAYPTLLGRSTPTG